MSCEVCYGYPSHNCPCCQDNPQESIIEAIEADENKFDILFEDKIVAVCSFDELQAFCLLKNLDFNVFQDRHEFKICGAGFEFWAIRQHPDTMDLWERAAFCELPISMHLFAGKAVAQ